MTHAFLARRDVRFAFPESRHRDDDMLPEASRAEVAERIALERLAVIRHYPIDLVSDDEVEEVLRRTETERASMPPRERARWLRAMCQDRPALALRHLVASTDDPDAHEDAAARGEPLEPSVDELDDGDPAWQPPAEFTEGIRYAFALRSLGSPYEDVADVLDEVGALPGAAGHEGELNYDRVVVARLFERGSDDLEREILRALPADAGPAWVRASTVWLACDGDPDLAERYMPAILAEAEEELRDREDPIARQSLDSTRRSFERSRAP